MSTSILTRRSILFLLTLALVTPAWAQAEVKSRSLKSSATNLIQAFQKKYGGKIGVSIHLLNTGKVLYSYNGTSSMVPASNLKLVTTAAALDSLGPDFRFETRLIGSKKIENGVMNGDLVLKGGGDPCFFPPHVNTPMSPFKHMAKVLKKAGIRKVTGDLIIDDSDFDREFIHKSYHERYRLNPYAAPVGGLSLNRNVVTLNVTPMGTKLEPDTGSIQIKRNIETAGYNQIWAARPRGTDKITVHGVVKHGGKPAQTTLTIDNPVRFAGSACYRLFEKQGIKFGGNWKLVPEGKAVALTGRKLLARHLSPPLSKLLEQTNVDSDNLFAQHIFKRLGATVLGYGNAANSESVIKEFLHREKVSSKGLKMVDGSGLSEKNRIAAYQIVHLLRVMWEHPQGQLYIDSLPGPGEGTLKSRLAGHRVRAKTGTLNNHSALSGYVVNQKKQTIAFSIIVNDIPSTWPATVLQDKLVTLLAESQGF